MNVRSKWTRRFLLLAGVAVALGAGRAAAAAGNKVVLCHVPPGNPNNVQLITVAPQSVAAHVANQGDAVCPDGAGDCCVDSAGGVTCTNVESDPANCGACGQACGTNGVCEAGQCVVQDQGPCDTDPANFCGNTVPCQDSCLSWQRADGQGCFCATAAFCFALPHCEGGAGCPDGMTCVHNCCGFVCEAPCQ